MFRVGVGIRVTACHSSGLGLCFGLRSELGLRLGFRCRELVGIGLGLGSYNWSEYAVPLIYS